MDAHDFITMATIYARLGSAVQLQLRKLIDEGVEAKLNPNAVRMILHEFRSHEWMMAIGPIVEAAKEWLDHRNLKH